jgi:hypothetical protein
MYQTGCILISLHNKVSDSKIVRIHQRQTGNQRTMILSLAMCPVQCRHATLRNLYTYVIFGDKAREEYLCKLRGI